MPAGLWLAVFMLLPLLILIVFSLGTRDALGRVALGFSLENYARFFCGPYLLALSRSMILAAVTTLTCLVFGFMVAMWLAFIVPKNKRNVLMTLIVLPLWTSFLLRIYAWMTILRPDGLACDALSLLGFNHVPHLLYSYWAVLIGMVYNYLPYMILPLYAALEKLDIRLVEAAQDLGASPWRCLFSVTLPLSIKGVVAGCIMVFVPSLGDYVTPDLLGGAKTMYIGNLIQNQFLVVRDWSFGCAVSTILILIVSVFVYIYLKFGQEVAVSETS